MLDLLERGPIFMGSIDNFERSEVVLIGAPMEVTVSFRPGTRKGPEQIRLVSPGLEEYSLDLNRDLADCCYYDAGDVVLPPGTLQESLRRIGAVTAKVLSSSKFPLVIGGEHLVSLAVIKEVARVYPELAVIQLDAHADLREDYLGERYSHATVMRRVADLVGGENIYQLGIRSGTREEIEFGRKHTNLFFNELIQPLQEIIPLLKGRPVYVTLDIDVVDPAYAPGTGAAEPCGCTSREIIRALHLLGGINVVGFDLVEVSPVYDFSERTALLAAKLVREAILSFSRRP
ncbi:MAG TPA: agmatinase [Peptococcaceae bacterium]|nr:agmatinase [Peptococcaceae bacterium]